MPLCWKACLISRMARCSVWPVSTRPHGHPLLQEQRHEATILIFFHLLTGIMICWLALSTVRAETGLPASNYAPRSGELTVREMTIAKNAAVFCGELSAHDGR